MQFKRVIRRWMLNGLGVVLVLLLILEIAMSMVVQSYYYQQVQNSLYARTRSLSDLLETYVNESGYVFSDNAYAFVESFPDKEKMELQILDAAGTILASSTGFLPKEELLPDYQNALENGISSSQDEAKGIWVGRNAAGEKVSSVTMLIFRKDGTLCGAVRCLSSMELIDRQIFLLISVLLFFALTVLFFVVLSNSYFISSILKPLMEIGTTAQKIAQGDYTKRIEKQYDDEIGELCETINHMASEIAAADRLQNEFIRSVSHELRTPLTAIKGWSDTLRDTDNVDNELLDKGLEVIGNETDRLSGMVEDLLDFSRIQQTVKVSSSKFEKLDLFAEIEETVFLFRDRARREGIHLHCMMQEELPPVFGDRDRLRQVFTNILDNAIKYSREEGHIRVDAAMINDQVQIVFSDDGIGIAPDALPNIKNKFFRANNAKPGSGIGLAVADEIIRAHKGTLEIESQEHKGTVVTITLPTIKREEL